MDGGIVGRLLAAPPMALVLGLVALMLWSQLAAWWWSGRRRQRREDLRRRLRLEDGTGPLPGLTLREVAYARDPRWSAVLSALPGAPALHRLIQRAGADLTVAGLLTRSAVAGGVGLAGGVAVTRDPGVAVLAAVVAACVPVLSLSRQSRVRVEKLWRQLPGALDLMTRSLRAGHGIGAALQLVGQESPLPVAAEFARAAERHRLGDDLGAALRSMADRNRACRDLRFFAIAVGLQRETGGNLVEILENLARTVRSRFVLQAKVEALTAEARLSTRVVGAMPFATFAALAVLRREYVATALQDPIGRGMLAGGFAWFAVGLLLMQRAMRVEV
ncbi:type II secretion system F family protein [Myxococcota bacterium]|nr:type II secretion system F family protein [Myxococcota bacterium]